MQSQKKEINWNKRIAVWSSYKRLPVSFFDDSCTQNFFQLLNSDVRVTKKNPMRDLLIDEFQIMQNNVKNLLKEVKCKISFGVDGWTAPNFCSYYGVTANFLNEEWFPVSFALDLIPSEGQHRGLDIAKLFLKCMKLYGLEHKIGDITLDNASSNTTFIAELGSLLAFEKIIFDTENQHFHCFAHILNLSVQDFFKAINVICPESFASVDDNSPSDDGAENLENVDDDDDDVEEDLQSIAVIINKIRKTFKKIRRSEDLMKKLNIWCGASDVKFLKPKLDVKTRWNSTSDMIETAFHLKPSLNLMWDNIPILRELKVYDSEWEVLKFVGNFLKHFKYVTNLLSPEKKTTLPIVVVAVNVLLDKIEDILTHLQENLDQPPHQLLLMNALGECRNKILKHYDKTNWVYCIAMILDPRH